MSDPILINRAELEQAIREAMGPYAIQVSFSDQELIFGEGQTKRANKIMGAALLALGLGLYLAILLYFNGFFLRLGLALVASLLLYVGLFFVRYTHIVLLDNKSRTVSIRTKNKLHRFAAFDDLAHFKDTDHRHRGRYRASALSVVTKDSRELRLFTYKKDKVAENFPSEINRLLWTWTKGQTRSL